MSEELSKALNDIDKLQLGRVARKPAPQPSDVERVADFFRKLRTGAINTESMNLDEQDDFKARSILALLQEIGWTPPSTNALKNAINSNQPDLMRNYRKNKNGAYEPLP